MTLSERQYFQFGLSLAQASFAYAELAKKTDAITHTRNKLDQIHLLSDLEPLAINKRGEVRDALNEALVTMQQLHATPEATTLIARQADEYSKSLVLAGDGKQLADFDFHAGIALGSLDEFERTSTIPEDPALHGWLTASSTSEAAKVWYAEGLMAGISQIAAQQVMPELLPPISDITTDLRGVRDWLATRLPDTPSPDLIVLRNNLDSFLQENGRNYPVKRAVTDPELVLLGTLSGELATAILGPDAVREPAPTTISERSPSGPSPTLPSRAAASP